MNIESVLNVLSADAYWTVNKALARAIGIEEAAFVAELLYKYRYWRDRGLLDDQGGFFYTSADAQAAFGVSDKVIARLTKSVQKQGLFVVKKRGVPAKNYWYPQWDRLLELISNPQTGTTIDTNSVATSDTQTSITSSPQNGVTGAPQKGVTITKKSLLRNQTKSSESLYRQVVECFSKGFEKLESSKLSWVGKEKSYGKAVTTIIKQAKSINQDWTDTEVWQEIRARAAMLLKNIQRERTLAKRGLKHDEYIAKLKFVPTTLMSRWNHYPVPKREEVPRLPEVVIPEDELAKHAELQ
jgi:hypothetical protein